MQLRTDDRVTAVETITEDGFGGAKTFVHAQRGDHGLVLLVPDSEWVDVYWERTGTIAVCHLSELIKRYVA